MSERPQGTSAKDGWITLAFSLALWVFLLAFFLGVGHELAMWITSRH